MLHVLDQVVAHADSLTLFAMDVVPDVLFDVGQHNMHINRALLPETPLATDGLIIRLPTITQSHKRHIVRVLEVHAEPGDTWLCDQHADAAILERLKRGDLLV